MSPGDGRLVGFEASSLELRNKSGIGQYAAQLLRALVANEGEWRYALLANRAHRGSYPAGIAIPSGRPFPNHSLWMQFVVPRIVRRIRPSLCHFTNYIAPLSLPCPFVVTLHDMSLFLHPGLQRRRSLFLVRSILPAVARKASAIIAVSHSAKEDILKALGVPADKVRVIYSAPGDNFHPITDQACLTRVRRKYRLEAPFVLSVGTLSPRKNLSRLIAGFEELWRRGRSEQLVIAGQLGWHYRPLLRQIENSRGRDSIRLLGYVPSEDLAGLYTLARALAFPSIDEGFGFPILEAMACGTPVLTSNCSAMAEVSGGAALLVDPLQIEEIGTGLLRLLTGESFHAELQRKGMERASQFSWTRAAEATSAVYRQIAR